MISLGRQGFFVHDNTHHTALHSPGIEDGCGLHFQFPLDRETLDHTNGAIDIYIDRTKDLECNSELVKRGEELRERLHNVGFHSATSLVLLGRKPPSSI